MCRFVATCIHTRITMYCLDQRTRSDIDTVSLNFGVMQYIRIFRAITHPYNTTATMDKYDYDIRQSIGTDIVMFDVFLQMQSHDRRIAVRVLANLNPLLLKITVIIYKNFALNKNPYQAQHSIFVLILCVLFILLRPIANIQQTNIFLFAT